MGKSVRSKVKKHFRSLKRERLSDFEALKDERRAAKLKASLAEQDREHKAREGSMDESADGKGDAGYSALVKRREEIKMASSALASSDKSGLAENPREERKMDDGDEGKAVETVALPSQQQKDKEGTALPAKRMKASAKQKAGFAKKQAEKEKEQKKAKGSRKGSRKGSMKELFPQTSKSRKLSRKFG